MKVKDAIKKLVSIHALTRSATYIHSRRCYPERFQSTHSRGVRLCMSITMYLEKSLFQSTHSRGVRQVLKCIIHANILFQSTHSRGVRPIASISQARSGSFNPRTHEECDTAYLSCPCWMPSFNPRTHEECDTKLRQCYYTAVCFNPRTHEECDGDLGSFRPSVIGFNPRTHEECDLCSLS